MPPKQARVLISFLFILSFTFPIFSQTPTSVDVMRDRISKAKANLVIKNYSAAIYELENIRRETKDRTIHRVVNVLLMHSYLEQGDYKRTQDFLQKLYKSKEPNAKVDYLAVAGQVVSGAKTQLKRYQSLGLSVSDEKLPAAATGDINSMRKTLEMVVEHSKVLGKNKKLAANSLALLEETTNARAGFARDPYDAKRWENEVSDTREQLASSGSRVINVLDDASIKTPEVNIVDANAVVKRVEETEKKDEAKIPEPETVAEKIETPSDLKRENESKAVENKVVEKKDPEKKEIKKESPLKRPVRVIGSAKREPKKLNDPPKEIDNNANSLQASDDGQVVLKASEKNVASKSSDSENGDPVDVGSLIGYATRRVNPAYPKQARNLRMTGVVKVELFVDEKGNVSKVGNTSGPILLKRAATAAARKWRFKPFLRDGQPVKASGFVNFNFSL